MVTDAGTESGYTPLLEQKVAKPGDFQRHLERSIFRESQMLPGVGAFVEAGQFSQGVDFVLRELAKRQVKIQVMPSDYDGRWTRVENGQNTILLKSDFKNFHPSKQLHSLIHRHMSLILQGYGKREDGEAMRDLLQTDVSYSESARLGARRIADPIEKGRVLEVADEIEMVAKSQLVPFPAEQKSVNVSEKGFKSFVRGIGRRIMRSGK